MSGSKTAGAWGTRRRWRRVEQSALPFWPRGLLPLIGLLLLLLFALTFGAKSWVQSDVARSTRDALRDAGLGWVKVQVSGQNVHLTGVQPKSGDGDRAVSIASAAEGGTWLGLFDATIDVTSRFQAPPPPPAPPPPSKPCEFVFRRSADKLVLNGELPSGSAKKAALERAAKIGGAKVEHQLRVLSQGAPVWAAVAQHGLEILQGCQTGKFEVSGGFVDVLCKLPESEKAAMDAKIRAGKSARYLRKVELLSAEAVESCEAELAKVLLGSVIEFSTGSAKIRPSASKILERVAKSARTCPGTLRIEGHTDDVGEPQKNLELSRQRAGAVRTALIQRGLSAQRLRAVGFGETRPVADNAAEKGRRKNRRIEVHVDSN